MDVSLIAKSRGRTMKAKIFVSMANFVFIGVLLVGEVAIAARIKEPTGPGGTLLIGRIKLTCTGFPRSWQANGDHTRGIRIDLKDSSNNFVSATSRGADGMFYFTDLDIDQYAIAGFQLQVGDSRFTLHLGLKTNDLFVIEENSVNNLGDIEWRCDYVTRDPEVYGTAITTTYYSRYSLEYKSNYDECRSWFEENFAKSAWNTMDWNNVMVKK
jgi:hypothetical protein